MRRPVSGVVSGHRVSVGEANLLKGERNWIDHHGMGGYLGNIGSARKGERYESLNARRVEVADRLFKRHRGTSRPNRIRRRPSRLERGPGVRKHRTGPSIRPSAD